ncbi:hypothetical protein COCVIDRAFT_113449, partial [Bipolaris victoriae FI3]
VGAYGYGNKWYDLFVIFLKERRMVEYVGIVNELGYTRGFLGGFFLNMLLRA